MATADGELPPLTRLQASEARMRADPRFSEAALVELRGLVSAWPDSDRAYCTDANLTRFLLAKEGNPSEAASHVRTSLTWRRAALPAPAACATCAADASAHSFIPIGWETSEGSPIIYGCPARASNSEVDPTVSHVASQLEKCFEHPASGGRWVWLVDYTGFGWSHAMQGSLAVRFATLFSSHMPERLHRIILVNPPAVFRMLLSVVTPFVDGRTMDKVVSVLGSRTEVIDQLRRVHAFPDSALSWFDVVLTVDAKPGLLPPPPLDSVGMFIGGMEAYLGCSRAT